MFAAMRRRYFTRGYEVATAFTRAKDAALRCLRVSSIAALRGDARYDAHAARYYTIVCALRATLLLLCCLILPPAFAYVAATPFIDYAVMPIFSISLLLF